MRNLDEKSAADVAADVDVDVRTANRSCAVLPLQDRVAVRSSNTAKLSGVEGKTSFSGKRVSCGQVTVAVHC